MPVHALQKILANAVTKLGGPNAIIGQQTVVGYEEKKNPETGESTLWATLEDGTKYQGDLLIGADGIWSKVCTTEP